MLHLPITCRTKRETCHNNVMLFTKRYVHLTRWPIQKLELAVVVVLMSRTVAHGWTGARAAAPLGCRARSIFCESAWPGIKAPSVRAQVHEEPFGAHVQRAPDRNAVASHPSPGKLCSARSERNPGHADGDEGQELGWRSGFPPTGQVQDPTTSLHGPVLAKYGSGSSTSTYLFVRHRLQRRAEKCLGANFAPGIDVHDVALGRRYVDRPCREVHGHMFRPVVRIPTAVRKCLAPDMAPVDVLRGLLHRQQNAIRLITFDVFHRLELFVRVRLTGQNEPVFVSC